MILVMMDSHCLRLYFIFGCRFIGSKEFFFNFRNVKLGSFSWAWTVCMLDFSEMFTCWPWPKALLCGAPAPWFLSDGWVCWEVWYRPTFSRTLSRDFQISHRQRFCYFLFLPGFAGSQNICPTSSTLPPLLWIKYFIWAGLLRLCTWSIMKQ